MKQDDFDIAIGQRLKLARKRRGMSQKELASQSGISYSSICKYEAGGRSLTEWQGEKLAEVLGVSTYWLLFGESAEEAEDETRSALVGDIVSQIHFLNDNGLAVVLDIIKGLSENEKYKRNGFISSMEG